MPNELLIEEDTTITKPLKDNSRYTRLFFVTLIIALVLGTLTGYVVANKKITSSNSLIPKVEEAPKSAQQDTKLCRDFADGTIEARKAPAKEGEYAEGSHMLVKEGSIPVALTSSVVDLSQYEGKKVRVTGETQKAIKEAWLMDVCKVDEK